MHSLRLLVLLGLVGCTSHSTAVSSPSPTSFDEYRQQTLEHLERERRF